MQPAHAWSANCACLFPEHRLMQVRYENGLGTFLGALGGGAGVRSRAGDLMWTPTPACSIAGAGGNGSGLRAAGELIQGHARRAVCETSGRGKKPYRQ